MVTKRFCLGLQRKDRELVLHGNETGRIVRHENGEYIEVHEPLDEQARWIRVSYDDIAPSVVDASHNDRGVKRKGHKWDRFKHRLSRFYFEDRVSPVTPAELEEAHKHHH
jgi:ubiquinol-cytochrome c reductase cytochrome b subunit